MITGKTKIFYTNMNGESKINFKLQCNSQDEELVL